MAGDKTEYFTVRVNGLPRKLFSINESNNGAVIINIASAKFGRSPGENPVFAPRPSPHVVLEKFTVHRSLQSTSGKSDIHLTRKYSDGAETCLHLWTRAIKAKKNFVFLAARRTTHLEDDRYLVAADAVSHDLGTYNWRLGTLYFSVLVAAPETEFTESDERFVVFERQFAYAKIIVLASGVSLPSDGKGLTRSWYSYHPEDRLLAFQSLPYDDPEIELRDIADGLTAAECVGNTIHHFKDLVNEAIYSRIQVPGLQLAENFLLGCLPQTGFIRVK